MIIVSALLTNRNIGKLGKPPDEVGLRMLEIGMVLELGTDTLRCSQPNGPHRLELPVRRREAEPGLSR